MPLATVSSTRLLRAATGYAGSIQDDKLCGVFSSEEEAERAGGLLTTQPGFRDHPNDFLVSAYELDKITWAEGFVTVEVDDEE